VRSHALALRLHNEVPGISVPADVLGRLDRAGAEAAREGHLSSSPWATTRASMDPQ
jgi:hypothetical protein